MDASGEVLEAAHRRAAALASGNPTQLRAMLHPLFRWYSHAGERFDRETYVRSNTDGDLRWQHQELAEVKVVAHERTAVLHCEVVDTVDRGSGPEELRMPMTQVWVRGEDGWVCLMGHAGPLQT